MSIIIAEAGKSSRQQNKGLRLPFGQLFPRPANHDIVDGGYSETSGVRSHRIDFTFGQVFVPVATAADGKHLRKRPSGNGKAEQKEANDLAAAARAIVQQQQQQQQQQQPTRKQQEPEERPWWPPSGPFVAFTGTFVDFFGLGCILPLLPFFVDSVFVGFESKARENRNRERKRK